MWSRPGRQVPVDGWGGTEHLLGVAACSDRGVDGVVA